MTTKAQVLFSIKLAWAGTPIEAICNTIVSYLSQSSDIRVINESTLQIWTDYKYSSDELLKAALYLSGRNPHLLEKQFIFELDEESEEIISTQDLIEAESDGYLPHPDTGYPIYDYEDYISFYFRPSKEANSLVGDE